MDLLKGGTAVIIGAASGIGQAAAIAFARDGCKKVMMGDINIDGLAETKRLIQEQYPDTVVETAAIDVVDESSVEAFHQEAASRFGRIDFAANSAGYGHPATPVYNFSEEEWDKTYLVNYRGVFLCERAQLKQMLGQEVLPKFGARGSIINITSLSHTMPVNDYTAYSASKGGVLGLAKSDAYDYGPESIRVNCIAPGMTVTPMLVEAYGDEGLRQLASVTPLRRNATPDDVAHAITWLSGPRASFITGSTITVDGGFNLRNGPP